MSTNKTFNNVQLDVKFTQASSRANLTSEENISISFGKLSKWYESLVPTGGSSGQILGWNSDGTAKWVTNPNTNTTYTFETGDSVGQIKVTPSDGTAYNVNVKNISAGTSTGTINSLAYYGDTTMLSSAQITPGTGLFFKSELNNAETPATLTTLCTYGPTYGNDARSLIGGTQGILSYGDGGPQIDFNTSRTGGQAGSLIFTDHDSVATGVSWTFVSNQADWNVISKRFHARTSISIGTNLPNTNYNLYVNGTTNLTGNTTIGGTLDVAGDITQNGVTISLSTHTHGLLHSDLNQTATNGTTGGWSVIGIDPAVTGYVLKSIRVNTTSPDWLSGDYGAGIAFGGWDTKGVISMKYNSPVIAFAGGNHNSTNTSPNWYIKITGTSGKTYNFDNYMGAVKIGSYYGMALPDGTDQGANSWIRTTRYGLIPYARNDDDTDGNVSALGTSTWSFAYGYINNLYYKDLKPITVVAGNTADNSIDKMAGSYFFQGQSLFGNTYDWIGIQAGTNNDKWQIAGDGSGSFMFRQNDAGGTNTTLWSDWKRLLIADSVTGSDGITVTKTTATLGSGDTALTYDAGVNITHSNSVTAETTFNKSRFKYDAQGHITESGYYVHTAIGTNTVAGWIKIATMKHLQTYDNTPIMLTLSQRGNLLTYRLHIQFSNNSSTDPPLGKFIISSDEAETWGTVYPRAYMIKTAAGTWDLYIQKKDNYEALAVTEFNVGKYFTDHMSWTWLDVQTDNSEITGGTEATRKVYPTTDEKLLQSNTTTSDYKPLVLGTTSTTDRTALNATVTGQGYVSNLMFSKPDIGYLYAQAFSTSSFIDGSGVQLTHYGVWMKSYKEAGLPSGGNYSYSRYGIRVHDGKAGDNNGMLLTMDSGGLTIVGGGESATSLASLISDDQRDSNTSRTRLNVGGTLNSSYHGSDEQLILSSDYNIYFLTNCNNVGNRKPVVLDANSYFYPGTTNTGSIGISSYYWNSAYIKALYLSASSTLTRNTGDTYYYAERSDTDVSVGFGIGGSGVNHGIYSFKLGGWMILGDASNVSLRATLYNPSTEASLYALPLFGGAPSTGPHALYNNDGFRYSTLEGTASAVGIARLVLGNSTASGTAENKLGSIRLYSQNSSYIDLSPASTSSAQTITIPATSATMAVNRKAMIVDETTDFASYSWHKFADVTLTTGYYDYDVTFLASVTWGSNLSKRLGLLTMHVRTSRTITFENGQLTWNFVGSDVDINDFVMVYYNTENTSLKVELYYKQKTRYDGYTFTILNENTRTTKEIYTMNLYTQYGHGSATLPTATGTVVSSLARIKNAPGIYAVKGTQSASTSVWTGNIDVSELYNGLTIAYYLPYSSTSTSVTLNLTLTNGSTTGAVNCYVNGTTRITNQYAAGSVITLTYWSAGSIGVNGTATTDNRWVHCG